MLVFNLASELAEHDPVAGCFVMDKYCHSCGDVVGCSVSIDCDGQGIEILHVVDRECMCYFWEESMANGGAR